MLGEQRNAVALLFLLCPKLSVMGAAKEGLKCDLSGSLFKLPNAGLSHPIICQMT